MGARSQRRCLPGPIPNPEVKPFCVSPITVVRESTGKEVTVPLSFHLGFLDPQGRLRPDLRWRPAFFAFYGIMKHHVLELARKGRDEHMPIDTVDIFGSDQAGIHLASVAGVLFHPPELPQPTVDILETCLELELHPDA